MSSERRQFVTTYTPPVGCPRCGSPWAECSCPKCLSCKRRVEECYCLPRSVSEASDFIESGYRIHDVSIEDSGAIVQSVSRPARKSSRGPPDLDAGCIYKRRHFPLAYSLRRSFLDVGTATAIAPGVRVEVARKGLPDGRLEVHIIIDEALEGGLKEPLRAAESVAQSWLDAVRKVQRPQGPREGFARVHEALMETLPKSTARQRQAHINRLLSAWVLEYAQLSQRLDSLFPSDGPSDPLGPWSLALQRLQNCRMSVHYALRHYNRRTSDKAAGLIFKTAYERAQRGEPPFPDGKPVSLYQVQQRERERRERDQQEHR